MNAKGFDRFSIFIIAAFMVACQTGADTGKRTEIIVFTPSVPTTSKPGQCGSQSSIVVRADARRCLVGHRIHDPCVAVGDKLVCGATPWSSADSFVTEAGLPPIDTPQVDPGGVIAMELADGARCTAVAGDTIKFDGKPVSYRCNSGDATERVVLGHPGKGKIWTADYVALGHNATGYFIHERKDIEVLRVWR